MSLRSLEPSGGVKQAIVIYMIKYCDVGTTRNDFREQVIATEDLKVKSVSGFLLLVTPWTAAYQAPPTRFSRQEYWSGLPLPSPELKDCCC